MKWFWQRKQVEEKPFRRIYKGQVPILRDSDAGLPKNLRASQSKGRSVRLSTVGVPRHQSTRSQQSNNDLDDLQPTNVRRQSVSPSANSHSDKQNAVPEQYPDNLVITSRYNLWNFIPKNLFEQFRRVVNFYFLVIAFVQTTIDSPVHPITAVSPLAFVILVTAMKQGYEDWLRHKSDRQVNDRMVRLVKDGKVEEIKSKDVQVGDIIKLEADEQVPTDILVLGSSDEFLRCQINTANLDGETNLKLRYCPSGLPKYRTPEDFNNINLIIECEHPCEDLYEFNGSLLIPANKVRHRSNDDDESSTGEQIASSTKDSQEPDQNVQKNHQPDILTDLMKGLVRQGITDFLSIPLSMDNMVLRGTRLKNTDFIYGIVIYTGKDTRLACNSEKTESKFSTVEHAVNYYLAFFIVILLLLVLFCCIMHFVVNHGSPWYDEDHLGRPEYQDVGRVVNTVLSFIILFNYIIPISLYVTIELQKFMGSKFFVWDNEMVDEEGKGSLCNTSDLNEELGLIQYLFSDKTGTLTQNVMKFRHCSIETVKYEYKFDEQQLCQIPSGEVKEEKRVDIFNNPNVLRFFKTLALCHSVQVVPKRRPSFEMDPEQVKKTISELTFVKKLKQTKINRKKEIRGRRASLVTPQPTSELSLTGMGVEGMEFQASSPDEKALLESCESLGIIYLGEKEDQMTLNINGEIETFRRLMTLEFDADRKCMSVIVENSKNEIWLLTKGAESAIIPKCDDGPTQETLKHVMDFALMGLRTLAVAVRKLTPSEFAQFNDELRAARRLLKNRQEKVREVYMNIENHMTLIGATGVEDQLQEYVPETLQSFAAAGIRVWMLTGDKLETGVNVAMSCGLITASTKQYIVSRISDAVEIKRRLNEIKNELDSSDNTCFVIDGEGLSLAFKECPDLLTEVAMAAFRVVCCRMAPLQKAQVVNMVKNSKLKPTCCAVGDGANDCAMILAAHIGIGILGKEGRQAARCADFALPKFGHMRKAILVHGHWYYVRLANLANYFFYKNVVFVLPQFFFSINSSFSTQALFNGLFLMCFNIFFASCPIFFYGLLEQPYPADALLRYPQLYKKNTRNSLMTVKQFFPWLVSAIWHSVVCYYLPYFSWGSFDQMDDVQTFGTVVFTCVVVVTNMKMFVETKFISWWYVGSQIFSYASFFVITTIVSETPFPFFNSEDFRSVFFKILSSLCFWLLVLLVGAVGVLPDITFAVLKRSWKKILRHFKSFGQSFQGRRWLKMRGKQMPFPTANLLFTKRTGSLAISNSTCTYVSNSNSSYLNA